MNDEAKCHGQYCAVREHCDRYPRPAGDRQTWLVIPQPAQNAQNAQCGLFVPVVEEVRGDA